MMTSSFGKEFFETSTRGLSEVPLCVSFLPSLNIKEEQKNILVGIIKFLLRSIIYDREELFRLY